jgi:predicted nucleic acid-binding protein
MMLYLDTSALVKLYVDEPKSEVIRIAGGQGEAVATSLLAYAEARARLLDLAERGPLKPTVG